MTTNIEWCKNPDGSKGETWNILATRQIGMGNANYRGAVKGGRWTGKIRLLPDALDKPRHWKKPRTIFVQSMGDPFHEGVPFEFTDKGFAVMALCPQHTFMIFTKRPKRMYEYYSGLSKRIEEIYPSPSRDEMEEEEFLITQTVDEEVYEISKGLQLAGMEWLNFWNARQHGWPLPNVRLYTSIEDQRTADERIPWLLKTPAVVRGISLEPMLGPVDLSPIFQNSFIELGPYIDHVIVGGESGPGARPMHPDWVRSVRDQCVEAGVKFFFEQWGAWWPRPPFTTLGKDGEQIRDTGKVWDSRRDDCCWVDSLSCAEAVGVIRIGKRAAGRELDGKTWDEMPGQAKEETDG